MSQAELDEATENFYDVWKERYLSSGCGDGRYFVRTPNGDNNSLSRSHGQGYGMLVSAIMEGYDPDAKAHFDGMYAFFRDHPSASSPDLMAWNQTTSCDNAQDGSAADGDFDIAFAMLLADKQWGSCGDIDYRGEALKIIEALKAKDLDSTKQYVLFGDWVTPDNVKIYGATRTSD